LYDIIIIGGGLSGLISARILALHKLSVLVIEKNKYPFHRVCGEYISNEVKPFLESIDCFPSELSPTAISQLEITAPSGYTHKSDLGMGGFGISRYAFDLFLKEKATEAGVVVIEGEQVNDVFKHNNVFTCKTLSHKEFQSTLVIGAQGKRSLMDKQLKRKFIEKKSPYIGVKYHVAIASNENTIALHNFENGYCGISKIEDGKFCLCYLTTRENLRKHGSIPKMEEAILFKNPYLKKIFTEAKFLYDAPEVINEISFETKSTQDNDLMFCGDAAGMIAPLCGNGMAMAIHSAKLLSESILKHYQPTAPNISLIHVEYQQKWNRNFKQRLWIGRTIQKVFVQNIVTEISLRSLSALPFIKRWLIKKTHGKEI
jgi:menaquinone-9 beta-reductase